MTTLLRLIRGDKRNPTDSLNLNDGAARRLRFSGFQPEAGEAALIWSGRNPGRDGQAFISGSRDNAVLSLVYDLLGDSPAHLMQLQRDVNRFLLRAGSEKVWLEYNWLDTVETAPALGQWSSYIEVRAVAGIDWPQDLHSPFLDTGIIEGVGLRLICGSYIEGLRNKALDNSYQLALSDEFAADFGGIGWVILDSGDFTAWEAAKDASNGVKIWWDASESAFVLTTTVGGVATDISGNAQSLSVGEAVHLALVNDADGGLTLYVNGEPDITTGGLSLGSGGTLTVDSSLTGWRVWAESLTADQVGEIYEAEASAAADLDGPVWLYDSGSNWGYIEGVSGDAPALAEWHLSPATTAPSRVYWLGRKAVDGIITPTDAFIFDFNETTTTSGSGADSHDFDDTLAEAEAVAGRVQVLARLRITNAAGDVYPYYQLGTSTAVRGDEQQISGDADYLIRDLGELFVRWPQAEAPSSLTFGAVVTETEATALSLGLQECWLLPYPLVRVECEAASYTAVSGDELVITDREAWAQASDGSQKYRFLHRGDLVTLEPGRRNYVVVVPAEEGETYTAQTVGLACYVTPRWMLGGGPVS